MVLLYVSSCSRSAASHRYLAFDHAGFFELQVTNLAEGTKGRDGPGLLRSWLLSALRDQDMRWRSSLFEAVFLAVQHEPVSEELPPGVIRSHPTLIAQVGRVAALTVAAHQN